MAHEALRINPGDAQAVVPAPAKKPPASQADATRTPKQDSVIEVKQKFDPDQLEQITKELNDNFRIFNTALSFSVDDNTGTTVIRILDRDTDKVIREIPPDELLQLAAKLTEVLGRLVDKTA